MSVILEVRPMAGGQWGRWDNFEFGKMLFNRFVVVMVRKSWMQYGQDGGDGVEIVYWVVGYPYTPCDFNNKAPSTRPLLK